MVTDLVTQQVKAQLAAKQSSLPASPLSSAHGSGAVHSHPLPVLSDTGSVQSLIADVPMASFSLKLAQKCLKFFCVFYTLLSMVP